MDYNYEEMVTGSENPMSFQEISNAKPFFGTEYNEFKLLPKTAINIQYKFWYAKGVMGPAPHEHCFRFEAPVDDCRTFAEKIIEKYNKDNPNFRQLPLTPVKLKKRESPFEFGELGKVEWFDIEKIVKGEVWGKNSSHTPCIWIDTERGILYYYESD